MRVMRLALHRVRVIRDAELCSAPGLNLVTCDNGAGKTSLLEAIHLLACGRSFRGRVRDDLIQTGADDLEVFAEWKQSDGRRRQLGELCTVFAALTFEPGSHALVSGGEARRYLDWGLFHVEREHPASPGRFALRGWACA